MRIKKIYLILFLLTVLIAAALTVALFKVDYPFLPNYSLCSEKKLGRSCMLSKQNNNIFPLNGVLKSKYIQEDNYFYVIETRDIKSRPIEIKLTNLPTGFKLKNNKVYGIYDMKHDRNNFYTRDDFYNHVYQGMNVVTSIPIFTDKMKNEIKSYTDNKKYLECINANQKVVNYLENPLVINFIKMSYYTSFKKCSITITQM